MKRLHSCDSVRVACAGVLVSHVLVFTHCWLVASVASDYVVTGACVLSLRWFALNFPC